MKIELSQECDYLREAECCRRMGEEYLKVRKERLYGKGE